MCVCVCVCVCVCNQELERRNRFQRFADLSPHWLTFGPIHLLKKQAKKKKKRRLLSNPKPSVSFIFIFP